MRCLTNSFYFVSINFSYYFWLTSFFLIYKICYTPLTTFFTAYSCCHVNLQENLRLEFVAQSHSWYPSSILADFTIWIFYFSQVEEVYNFSQDDLLTEDVLILDSHAEVFVWVGQSADSTEKQSSLENGQVLLD